MLDAKLRSLGVGHMIIMCKLCGMTLPHDLLAGPFLSLSLGSVPVLSLQKRSDRPTFLLMTE